MGSMSDIPAALHIISESEDEPIDVEEAGFNLRAADDGNSPPTYVEADLIARLIKVAREACEEETELSILQREYEATYDCFRAAQPLQLPRPPVHSIVSVKYIDQDGAEQTLSTDVYALDNRDDLRPAWLRLKYRQSWPSTRRESGAVRVRYIAGFRLDISPPDVVRAPLRQAMHLLIAHYFVNREAAADDSLAELPLGVRYLLLKYRVHMGV
jgi:uncharacterized phiE125 gp8 family phage protein